MDRNNKPATLSRLLPNDMDGVDCTVDWENISPSAFPQVPALLPGQVHIWSVQLDESMARSNSLLNILSDDEQKRADRFVFQRDRARYISARITLRLLLAGYQECHPQRLFFNYGKNGKPYLNTEHSTGIEFNLSHTGTLILLAFSRSFRVGIDTETIRDDFSFHGIAEHTMHSREMKEWQALPSHLKVSGFFHWWTRKEACFKAIGSGLSAPMSKFCVSAVPNSRQRILHIDRSDGDNAPWSLLDLTLTPGYIGALATDGQPNQVLKITLVNETTPISCRSADPQPIELVNDGKLTTGSAMPTQVAGRPAPHSSAAVNWVSTWNYRNE